GVKWKTKRGWRASHAFDLRMLVCGVVVDDHMDDLARWHLGLDGIEEADELLMAMALHTAADDLALEHVESGEERGCAVADVVVTSWCRAAPSSSASRAGCDRGPEFGSSHRPTARQRGPADRHRGRQSCGACQRKPCRSRA